MPRAKPDKRPWFPLYPTDYLGDPDLARCSLAAQGLWTRMLCLIHICRADGRLLIGGKKATPERVARELRHPLREIAGLLRELEEEGVLTKRGGHIISRRMERDAKKAKNAAKNGGRGGNPALISGPKLLEPPEAYAGRVNPRDNPADKPQRPETRSQKPEDAHTRRGPPRAAPDAQAALDAARLVGAGLTREHPVTEWEPTLGDMRQATELTRLSAREIGPFTREFREYWTGKGARAGWSGLWIMQLQKAAPSLRKSAERAGGGGRRRAAQASARPSAHPSANPGADLGAGAGPLARYLSEGGDDGAA